MNSLEHYVGSVEFLRMLMLCNRFWGSGDRFWKAKVMPNLEDIDEPDEKNH